MRNPFYMRQMTQLVDAFNEMDIAADKIASTYSSLEYVQLQEFSGRLKLLLPLVDTLPLPGSAIRAARDVGDFFYLLTALTKTALEQSDESMKSPTVRDARKYDVNPFVKAASLQLEPAAVDEMLVYREKARETLRGPAKRYGLSCEKSFVPHIGEEPSEAAAAEEVGE